MKCDICDQEFANSEEVKRHKEQVHPMGEDEGEKLDRELLEAWLTERRGANVRIHLPQRGPTTVDFYFPAERLVIEVDSWTHHRSRASFEDVFAAVEGGDADLAMIPIDNSLAGRVAGVAGGRRRFPAPARRVFQAGDRTLNSLTSEDLCFAWNLPFLTTGPAFMGATTTATFTARSGDINLPKQAQARNSFTGTAGRDITFGDLFWVGLNNSSTGGPEPAVRTLMLISPARIRRTSKSSSTA